MDSQHSMYGRFAEMIADSFYVFLCELEKSDAGTIDCPFMNKLHDIDKILRKLFEKGNSPTLSIHPAKQISTRNECIPPKIKINKEKISTSSEKKRKSTDGDHHHRSHSDDIFERMKIYISRDVEGSDDSDCEMKTVPVRSEDLFNTDYPEECFLTEEKKENEVSCQDVSSSLNKSLITSIEDDPYIRKLNTEKPNIESNGDTNDQHYPYIDKIIDDVYKCTLCLINNLPQNNVAPHVNGRQHKNALLRLDGSDLKLKEVIPKMKDVSSPMIPVFECTLCKTEINCRENALQHINGRQHTRKLENARANA